MQIKKHQRSHLWEENPLADFLEEDGIVSACLIDSLHYN